ncbi:hypothetical protein [Streptomyces sp. NPDC050535]|uniref:hypothetical protein n=1 Tax=Streptomyces sp. NPDC050535 TaxID=3365626 RepID=UPI0037890BA1
MRIEGVDVLRIHFLISADVLAVLRDRRLSRGAVLCNVRRRCVEMLVPPGTAATWPALPYTVCVADAVMCCPSPEVTSVSGRGADGRVWTAPPAAAVTTTDADALAEAVATVLVRRAAPWLDESPPTI